MKSIGLNELRRMFREFYEERGHFARHSFSLVPEGGDRSLLLINSGMAPLKPYFSGAQEPPAVRMTTCQKCIRTGDLDHVGHTARHGTFFEMMGSFSFGDYFKRESLVWGWEFLLDVLGMPVDRLWASIYEDDDEAYDIWVNDVGIDPERVVRLGKSENFWEIGLGPCGPCSEVYFDRGERYGCDSEDCKPGCECDRYVEFWNHVFTQFSRDEEGNYTPLAQKNIDTGLGLERLACIMQGTDSIFDVDTIRVILDEVCRVSGVAYEGGSSDTDVSIRVVTDHIRSVVFLIGDGVAPSNENRGYVLRRLLRRAVVHARKLGITDMFLHELADKVIEVSGHEYTEIAEQRDYIKKMIKLEEERFAATIDQGLELLAGHVKKLKGMQGAMLPGENVFTLYDTYGMNPELTREVLSDFGIGVDEEGFAAALKAQQEKSRRSQKMGAGDEGWGDDDEVFRGLAATEFYGYGRFWEREEFLGNRENLNVLEDFKGTGLPENVTVNLIIVDGKSVEEIGEGESGAVVLDRTPFYAEGGGQASDIGELRGVDDGAGGADTGISAGAGVFAEVNSVARAGQNGSIFVHNIEVKSGRIRVGDRLVPNIDRAVRNKTARNHTATHLLHKALIQALGTHVRQAGSSVDANVLRFDFAHFEGLSASKLHEVERAVNEAIDRFLPVATSETTLDEAKARGALAFFDEKYGDKVRLVEIGGYSAELCGGTHVMNTGEIGGFKIASETSVGSGTRRIEAITGSNLLTPLMRAENILKVLSKLFEAQEDTLVDRISAMLEDMREAKRALKAAKKAQAGDIAAELIEKAQDFGGSRLVTGVFDDMDADGLRTLSDDLKTASGGLVNVLISTAESKVTIITSVTDDLLDKGIHAGNLVKELAAAGGGGGGGKADMAQAGTKDPEKIPAILKAATEYMGGMT
ncbi:MAG: alanine--tRNA ligase [Clostridiales bacterium]|nr:alanine--tRNA ligase [Clostridiales bacterium]